MKKYYACLLSFLLCSTAISTAQVKLIPLFSDNMVLQQQTQAPIWGETKPGKTVEVTTSWDKEKYTVTADAKGKWMVKVATPEAGGPYSIVISDGKKVTLDNVLIGEVWLCSGQSNMEMPVEGWGKVKNYEQEIADANYPNIRFLQVTDNTSPQPLAEMQARNDGWMVCSPETVKEFSATGYFFGRDLNHYRNVPVGLIDSSWGGTIIEAWTSEEALSTIPEMMDNIADVKSMPLTNEERQEKYRRDMETWADVFAQTDKGFSNGKAVWADLACNDASWGTMNFPGGMDNQGLGAFDGVVWFRKVVEIPASWEGKELQLNLGMIDDNDFTYFNGVCVGHTEGPGVMREYTVPKDLVKGGKAVIAVRLLDTGGLGGINGAPEQLVLQRSKKDKISLTGQWKYKVSLSLEKLPALPINTVNQPNMASVLFNAMIHPLVPFAIKGAIWYQGESNSDRAFQYRDLMPLMIADWRKQWGYEFPFYMVQLANYMAPQTQPEESAWAELRDAQYNTLHLRNTGMAVIIDIGEAGDIHPKNKQEVGHRLALAARAQTYGETISYSGPLYKGYRIEGNKIRIFFKHANGCLKARNGGALKGFTIAGTDHKFYAATAEIDGNSIVVYAPEVAYPLAVRYAWANNPDCNLVGEDNLPASPFRTDDWAGITFGKKY